MPAGYVPDRGDVVWISLDPQAGHEQAGRRPAVVVSPRAYNVRVGLFLACPITSRVKGYPFEAPVPPGLDVAGAILSDQVKSLDWRGTRAKFHSKLPPGAVLDVLRKLQPLISAGGD